MVVKEDQRQAERFTAGVRKLISSSWCLVFDDSLTRLVDEIGPAKLPTNSRMRKFKIDQFKYRIKKHLVNLVLI